MKLYYYKDDFGNFGDDLNVFFWEKIWPEYSEYTDADWLVGIGSIFTGKIDRLPGTKLIMGSGYWPIGDGKPDLASCRIGFVRGPLTCRELGLDENLAITDTAALVSTIVSRPAKIDERVGFMPHQVTSVNYDCSKIAEMANVRYIDPTGTVDTVMNEILQSPKVLVEAMHGAIVADAMGIPWQRISLFNRKIICGETVDHKWQDWGASLDLDTTPVFEKLLPFRGRNSFRRMIKSPYIAWNLRKAADEIRTVLRRGTYRLSNRALLDLRVNQLQERIETIRSGKFFRI